MLNIVTPHGSDVWGLVRHVRVSFPSTLRMRAVDQWICHPKYRMRVVEVQMCRDFANIWWETDEDAYQLICGYLYVEQSRVSCVWIVVVENCGGFPLQF